MRVTPAIAAVTVVLLSGLAFGQVVTGEGRFEQTKFPFEFLEKTYGTRLKSAKFTDGTHVFLVEFTKDIDDDAALQAMKSALRPAGGGQGVPGNVMFHFFDADNVLIAKQPVAIIVGEITGVKGDAFRIAVANPTLERTNGKETSVAKIEPRATESKKDVRKGS